MHNPGETHSSNGCRSASAGLMSGRTAVQALWRRAGRPGRQEHRLPLSTRQVRPGPRTACRMTRPDPAIAPPPSRLACRQPSSGMPGTPPCRANQAAAAAGDGCPPRPGTSDTANPDQLAQEDPAAGTAGAGGASPAPDPHAGAASATASRQLPKTNWRNPMLNWTRECPSRIPDTGRKTRNLASAPWPHPQTATARPNPHWPDPADFTLPRSAVGVHPRSARRTVAG
jgi:hypothetical protein